jgi:hypothetical protein
MQILTIKNQNLEKPSRNPFNRTIVKFLKKKKFLDISQKKFGSAYAQSPQMFELRNSGKNRRKLSQFFFENLPRAYKDLI